MGFVSSSLWSKVTSLKGIISYRRRSVISRRVELEHEIAVEKSVGKCWRRGRGGQPNVESMWSDDYGDRSWIKNIWWSEMNWQWKTVKNMREWQGDGEALIGFEHWMNTKRWRAGYRTNRLCPRLLNHSPVFVITIKLSVSSPCTPQYLQISNQMFFEFKKNPFFSSRHTARRNKAGPYSPDSA